MNGFAMLVFAGFVIFSKFIVIGCQKLRIPPVIGLIFFGLLCGPSVFNIAHDNETHLMIEHFSEIGVVILLFIVGLETDLDQLKKMGKNSFWIHRLCNSIQGIYTIEETLQILNDLMRNHNKQIIDWELRG